MGKPMNTDFQVYLNNDCLRLTGSYNKYLNEPEAAVKIQRAFRKFRDSKPSIKMADLPTKKGKRFFTKKKHNVLNLFSTGKTKMSG